MKDVGNITGPKPSQNKKQSEIRMHISLEIDG